MYLSTLPLVVMDTLLAELDLKSLLALSSTCRNLHAHANRILYREPCFRWLFTLVRKVSDILELERSLSINPANVQYLRRHDSANINLLRSIWSQSPVTLTELRINSIWFTSSNAQQVADCISAKHRDTYVRKIFLRAPKDGVFHGFFGLLHTFHGLQTLHVTNASFSRLCPDIVIDQLNCPQLKQLHLGESDIIPSIGNKLPNLEVLTIRRYGTVMWPHHHLGQRSNDEAKYYTLDEKWARLHNLMTRKINFAQGEIRLALLGELVSLPFVFEYARKRGLNPTPIVQWLLVSQNLLQDERHRWVNLTRLSPGNRDSALEVIKSLDFEPRYRLCIRLHTHDSPCLAKCLPNDISHLEISVARDNRVKSTIVSELVRSLPNLRKITIWLNLVRINRGQLICIATCLASDFKYNPPSQTINDRFDGFGDVHYKFRAERDKARGWTITNLNQNVEIDCPFPEVEREVTDWFSLNPAVVHIEVTFASTIEFLETDEFDGDFSIDDEVSEEISSDDEFDEYVFSDDE